jgi:hypothetical protein
MASTSSEASGAEMQHQSAQVHEWLCLRASGESHADAGMVCLPSHQLESSHVYSLSDSPWRAHNRSWRRTRACTSHDKPSTVALLSPV